MNNCLKPVCLMGLMLMLETAVAWMDCYWPYRSEVVINEVSGLALSDRQVLLQLDSSMLHADYNWTTMGQDLRLVNSDDSTLLSFFIQRWNQTEKTAELWVKVPTLAANESKTIYLYYGNEGAASASSAPSTFPDTGIKYHTRYSAVNPANKMAAFAAFNAANDSVAGYGCTLVSDFDQINNRSQFSPPSVSSNIAYYSETFFEVGAGESGAWSIRLGGDFGHGAGIYVDGQLLVEDWGDDLWWSFNWGSADVLQGTMNLTEGYHHLEVIGLEGCCDGGATLQFRKPNGSYQNYSVANINIRSRQCPVGDINQSYQNPLYRGPEMSIDKSSVVISDPINDVIHAKRIPGARVRYTVVVTNTGGVVDLDSIVLIDHVPVNTDLQLESGVFVSSDGTPPSSLSFNYTTVSDPLDDVSFSNDNALSFTYIPMLSSDNTDAALTHFQLAPKGRFSCANEGESVSFSVSYDVTLH